MWEQLAQAQAGGGGGLDTGTLVQLLLALFGTTGVLGALVALFKLKPDVNSAAVTQAQGAMTTMETLNKQLEEDRDRWREEALANRGELTTLRQELDRMREERDRLYVALHGRRRGAN